ncbi:MAG: hypothetical protein ABIS84_00280 [Arachnia sp.]
MMWLLSVHSALCVGVNRVAGLSCGPLNDPNTATAIIVACGPVAVALGCMLGRRSQRLRMRASLRAGEARNLGWLWGTMSFLQTLCTIAALALALALTARSDVPMATSGRPMTGWLLVALVIGVAAALVLTGRRRKRVEHRELLRAGWDFIPDAGNQDGGSSRTRPVVSRGDSEPPRCRCNTLEYCPVHPSRGVSDMPNRSG